MDDKIRGIKKICERGVNYVVEWIFKQFSGCFNRVRGRLMSRVDLASQFRCFGIILRDFYLFFYIFNNIFRVFDQNLNFFQYFSLIF